MHSFISTSQYQLYELMYVSVDRWQDRTLLPYSAISWITLKLKDDSINVANNKDAFT